MTSLVAEYHIVHVRPINVDYDFISELWTLECDLVWKDGKKVGDGIVPVDFRVEGNFSKKVMEDIFRRKKPLLRLLVKSDRWYGQRWVKRNEVVKWERI